MESIKYKCDKCDNETLIFVSSMYNVPFYSCYTDDCEYNAVLLVKLDDGIFVPHTTLLESFLEISRRDDDE